MTVPNRVKLTVTAFIDSDVWEQLKSNGYSEKDLQAAIEKQITLRDAGDRPLFDLDKVTLEKYY